MLSTKQAAQPNPKLSRLMSSGHHVSMEHQLRRKHLLLNPDTYAGSGMYVEKKKKKETNFSKKTEKKEKFGKMEK